MRHHWVICLMVMLATIGTVVRAGELIAPPRHVEPALENRLDRSLLTYVRDSVLPCFADYVPTPREVDAKAKVQFAKNEYEPLQLGLYVPSTQPTALTNVKIEVLCELPHRIGSLYYEPNARRRLLDYGRVYDHRRPSMPLYLIPGNLIRTIRPGHSAAFWVTIGDREGVQPGSYKASIVVTADGIDPVKREVDIRVHPFALPRPRAAFGCYYRIDRVPVYYGLKYQQLYARDQAEHGHNCAQLISYFSAFGREEFQTEGKVPVPEWIEKWQDLMNPSDYAQGVIDPGQFLEAQMNMFRRAGLTHTDIPVFGVQDDPTGPR